MSDNIMDYVKLELRFVQSFQLEVAIHVLVSTEAFCRWLGTLDAVLRSDGCCFDLESVELLDLKFNEEAIRLWPVLVVFILLFSSPFLSLELSGIKFSLFGC
ncbi:hypothetical protein M5K25_023715 [Dendrobium thyrsiflorum]|uniref:Uncharacterized protein n=1 Tax=Dendrobium thyrsiflorum TaxID=117978 RepID=A0ABD0TZZ3_DENTH